MQRAFVETIVLGLACGPLGVWILLLRRSYAAESLSHAMLPGLVIAALAGLPLIFGAAAGVLVAAILIAAVRGDVGVAVVVSGLFGLGGILALSPETPPRLGELLFGDLLGVTTGDLLVAVALTVGVLVALALAYRSLAVAGFEQRGGRADLALLAILGVTTVAAVQGLGNLLLVALILAPAAAALNLAQRLPSILTLAAVLAVVSGVAGLVISYQLELAAGASIALCATALSGVALLKPKLATP
ncbi:metal ABC transporter permease [Solirubrobacter sp. CPCC 204708]|uniref:Metal ABC transporter permease n=1 Tax=Solirubrobacter deserti TaxID=2282478 RepID=A0ABT4RH42_9ACTN|nr:metal ABC transporter permease [Solirubrobacter deserti]MBE2315154.1 metal ABC transporter permease [Solirubrobacter deserti]MDA0137837.1 metal ABC transporter permease [Solirubrobacter deserti]